jgi:RimJ/RimL family protein N-acetyltransferase
VTPTIETARLRLRPFVADDLDAYHATIYGDPEVMRFMPGGVAAPRSRAREVLGENVAHGREHGYTLWAVELSDDGAFAGHCGLMTLGTEEDVEVAYALGRAFWGRGLATEGARAAVRYGFEHAGLDAIHGLAVRENAASRRVLEHAGLRELGPTSAHYGMPLVVYRLERRDFAPDDAPFRVSWPDSGLGGIRPGLYRAGR